MLAAGKGKVELEIETMDGGSLAALIGLVPQGEYTLNEKGTVTLSYDVKEDTWFFAFPVFAASSGAPARDNRAPQATQGSLKLYSVKIIPSNEADGIEHIRTDLTGNGFIYNVQGQRVSIPKKGLYIIEGRKIVIK